GSRAAGGDTRPKASGTIRIVWASAVGRSHRPARRRVQIPEPREGYPVQDPTWPTASAPVGRFGLAPPFSPWPGNRRRAALATGGVRQRRRGTQAHIRARFPTSRNAAHLPRQRSEAGPASSCPARRLANRGGILPGHLQPGTWTPRRPPCSRLRTPTAGGTMLFPYG